MRNIGQNKITIPKVRLEDKSYMDYEEWEEHWEERKSGVTINENTNNSQDDDDLPF